MRRQVSSILVGLAIVLVPASRVLALDLDPAAAVSDLNAAALYLSKDKMTNADVMALAGIGCANVRASQRDHIPEITIQLFQTYHPSPDQMKSVDIEQFIAFEKQTLAKFGANEKALEITERTIRNNQYFPLAPSFESLNEKQKELERSTCTLRAISLEKPDDSASSDTADLGWAIGWGVIGVGAIVVNAKVAIDTGGLAGALISAVSMDWGFGQVHRAADGISKSIDSAFK